MAEQAGHQAKDRSAQQAEPGVDDQAVGEDEPQAAVQVEQRAVGRDEPQTAVQVEQPAEGRVEQRADDEAVLQAEDRGSRQAVQDQHGVNWAKLREAAIAAAAKAYVPYSNYPVGAAALVDDGRIISGCNIENASYGVTLCAECTMVGQLHLGGRGAGALSRLVAFDCVNANGETITPCGRCRQLLLEHAAPGFVLNTPGGIRTMDEMLPQSFGPAALEVVRG